MKILILFSCAFAAVSAGIYSHNYYNQYESHVPEFRHNGLQHEVSYTTHHVPIYSVTKFKSDYAQVPQFHGGHSFGSHSFGSHSAHPQDTPEVLYAKAQHFAAHEEARKAHHLGHAYTITPVETHEVQIAKAAHFKAHEEARNSHHHYTITPIETPEVQHARAQHLAAHVKANAHVQSYQTHTDHSYSHGHYRRRRGIYDGHFGGEFGGFQSGHEDISSFGGHEGLESFNHDFGHSSALSGHSFGAGGHGTLIHDGKHPVDTYEVQKAKALHFAAHSKAHHF